MIRRTLWLAVGAAGAALIVRFALGAGNRLSPGSAVHVCRDLADSTREFTADVRSAMRAHEQHLRATLVHDADR